MWGGAGGASAPPPPGSVWLADGKVPFESFIKQVLINRSLYSSNLAAY